ncbi:MAG: DUF1508 domain-containing protein [Spirochaetaceae bacterium]|nr:DUF1508 domain-containing protein [Spirochaetaceae bacterium]
MGKFVIKKSASGVRFNLKARNGQIIAVSEVYSSEDACRNGIDSVIKNAAVAKVEDQTVENYDSVTNPKFEIYKDKGGEFRFRLKSRNGENIAASEGYVSKTSCKNGIESVRKNSQDATIVEE